MAWLKDRWVEVAGQEERTRAEATARPWLWPGLGTVGGGGLAGHLEAPSRVGRRRRSHEVGERSKGVEGGIEW